jgi:hypothetical protein
MDTKSKLPTQITMKYKIEDLKIYCPEKTKDEFEREYFNNFILIEKLDKQLNWIKSNSAPG